MSRSGASRFMSTEVPVYGNKLTIPRNYQFAPRKNRAKSTDISTPYGTSRSIRSLRLKHSLCPLEFETRLIVSISVSFADPILTCCFKGDMDSLRPITSTYWRSLPTEIHGIILRHYFYRSCVKLPLCKHLPILLRLRLVSKSFWRSLRHLAHVFIQEIPPVSIDLRSLAAFPLSHLRTALSTHLFRHRLTMDGL